MFCDIFLVVIVPFFMFFIFSPLHCRCCHLIATHKLLTILSQLDLKQASICCWCSLNSLQIKKKKKNIMDCLFLLWVAYLGKIQRSPCHEGKDSESGHVMSYNQIVSHCTFTKKWKKKTKKKENVGSSTQHSKVDLISHSPVPLIEEIFFAFAGEWSGHVCQWQGSLFSLTLITSFTNLQIYYSTVCVKESMPSPAAWSLDLWWQQDQWSYSVEISQFRTWAVWK